MSKSNKPSLSITLVTPTSLSRIEETIVSLEAQTIREQLELILIAPPRVVSPEKRKAWEKVFYKTKLVETEGITNVSKAAFKGVPHAEADVIVFMEDHVYPIEKWAEHLLQAHQSPYAAVGSNYLNANPKSGWSWSALFLYYGPYVYQKESRESEDLPLHNISYKMEVIRPYYPQFSTLFIDWENGLHPLLQKAGHRLYFERKAEIYHRNATDAQNLSEVSFAAGQLYSHHRATKGNWSIIRRLLYFFGSPLIPPLRLFQFLKLLKKDDNLKKMPFTGWTSLFIQLVFNGMGQAIGFLFGKGNADRVIMYHELIDRKSIS